MKLNPIALTIIFLLCSNSWAQETLPATNPAAAQVSASYKIRQVIADQNIVVVESTGSGDSLKPGKLFLVTFPNEKQCSLVLKSSNGNIHTLGSSSCANASEITKNLVIEVALVDIPATPNADKPALINEEPAPTPSNSHPRLSLSVHYSGANEFIFSNAYVSTASGSGKLELNLKSISSPGIALSLARMKPQGWGLMANLIYEPSREINGITMKGAGGTYAAIVTGTKPKISILSVETNLVYQWDTFYMPFGLNISAANMTDTGGSSVTYNSGAGLFFGGGMILNDHASIEFFVRSLGFRITESAGTTVADYGYGSITGFGAGYKFWF